MTESVSMPKNVMHMSRPIDLDGLIRSPAFSQISCIIVLAFSDWGQPIVRKSSM